MNIDLSRYKVVYGDKVLNAVALMTVELDYGEDGMRQIFDETCIEKPKEIEIIAINEDNNIIVIHDEAWRFQFVPIVTK